MASFYGPTTNHWKGWVTAKLTDESGPTAVTATVYAGAQAVSYGFAISSGFTSTISVSGVGSKSGTGGLSSPTGGSGWNEHVRWTGTLQRTHSGFWLDVAATVTNASGYMNGTSSASGRIWVPAKASYAITLDANGGSGTTTATKWHGEPFTFPATVPTREGFAFLGWAASQTAQEAEYGAGETVSDSTIGNAARTLYAVWQPLRSRPKVDALTATRDGGTVTVSCTWAAGEGAGTVALSADGETLHATGDTSGAGGTCSATMELGLYETATVTATVTDGADVATASVQVGAATPPVSVANRGRGVGILATAPTEGVNIGGSVELGGAVTMSGDLAVSGDLTLGGTLVGDDTGWTTLWESGTQYIRYRVKLGVCYLDVYANSCGTNGWTCPSRLPATARPSQGYVRFALSSIGGSWNNMAKAAVGTDGSVWLANYGTMAIGGFCSWPVG